MARKEQQEAAAVFVPIGDLRPWEENPRRNQEAIPRVAESIRRFGFLAPIIARRDGEIIAGHTRWEAAKTLGLDRVPVRYTDLDPVDARLYALADNKLSEIADWDEEALARAVAALQEEGQVDGLMIAGFSEQEQDALLVLLTPEEDPVRLEGDGDGATGGEEPVPDDGCVDFVFGEHKGRVDRAVYQTFVSAFDARREERQAEGRSTLLTDVLADVFDPPGFEEVADA